jgi:hypothetical protein
MQLACPVCQEVAELALRGPTQIAVGSVSTLVERRPVVGCAGQHEQTPPEVVGAAMLAANEQLPRARRKLLSGDRCGACGTALSMPVRRTTRAITVDGEGLPVVTIHFDLPSSRCPDCGLDQLPTRSQEDLVVSIPAAFAAGGEPTG